MSTRSIRPLALATLAAFGLAGQSFAATDSDNFVVQIAIAGTCAITNLPDINFGTHNPAASTETASGSVEVTCSPGTAYTVGLDGGGSGDVTDRKMNNGSGGEISYALKTSGGANWGNTAGSWVSATAPGGGVTTHTISAEATLTAVTPLGNYSDTITATVTF